MRMTKYFICCQQCFELIGKKSTKAAKAWMDICALRLEVGEIFEVEKDLPEIRTLEQLGFLVSTDKPSTAVIKVHGHIIAENGEHFFCVKEGKHG